MKHNNKGILPLFFKKKKEKTSKNWVERKKRRKLNVRQREDRRQPLLTAA